MSFCCPRLGTVVPSLWPLEVANVLLVSERRKRCSEAEAVRFVELLESLPIATDDDTARRALNRTYQLAREYALTAYDAAYLELAMCLGVPLATMDRQLADAATKAGVATSYRNHRQVEWANGKELQELAVFVVDVVRSIGYMLLVFIKQG